MINYVEQVFLFIVMNSPEERKRAKRLPDAGENYPARGLTVCLQLLFQAGKYVRI